MSDDLSTQILNQTTESIQKLFDLSTRIDERVKTLQECEGTLKTKVQELKEEVAAIQTHLKVLDVNGTEGVKELKDRVKQLEFRAMSEETVSQQLQQCQLALVELDKKLGSTLQEFEMRITAVASSQQGTEDRWGKVTTFAIQLIWVIVAAWILATLGLQAPP